MVTSGGATIWKSASNVVFVEGTMTPIRVRRLMSRSPGRFVGVMDRDFTWFSHESSWALPCDRPPSSSWTIRPRCESLWTRAHQGRHDEAHPRASRSDATRDPPSQADGPGPGEAD